MRKARRDALVVLPEPRIGHVHPGHAHLHRVVAVVPAVDAGAMPLGELVRLGRAGSDAAGQAVGERGLEGVALGLELPPVVLAQLRGALGALLPGVGVAPALLGLQQGPGDAEIAIRRIVRIIHRDRRIRAEATASAGKPPMRSVCRPMAWNNCRLSETFRPRRTSSA